MTWGLLILIAAVWFAAGHAIGVRRERRRMAIAIQRMVDQYPVAEMTEAEADELGAVREHLAALRVDADDKGKREVLTPKGGDA